VGVAADIVVPGAARQESDAQFYQALGGAPRWGVVLIRSDLSGASVFASVSDAIHATNPAITIGALRSPDTAIATWRMAREFTLRLIASFSLLALVLAAVGLHATISYSVSQRTREIGIRVALGAQSQNVMGLVMAQGIKLTLAGLALGALGGVWAGRAMRALLYHVAPGDPATLGVVGVLLAAIAVVASYPSARRAVRVDPLEALRAE
jgi:putative ABC transport system permease protein